MRGRSCRFGSEECAAESRRLVWKEPVTAAVVVATSVIAALMAVSSKGSRGLGLDQGLEALAHQFRDQLTGGAAAKQLRQLMPGLSMRRVREDPCLMRCPLCGRPSSSPCW